MPDDSKQATLQSLVSLHSDLQGMHEQFAKVYKANGEYSSADCQQRIANTHRATSDILYKVRMFIVNDLLADPEIENECGTEIRRLLKERGLLELL